MEENTNKNLEENNENNITEQSNKNLEIMKKYICKI